MHLNKSQKIVITQRGPRTLALAGAGTGKTTTCIHWVASLIYEGVPPKNILMLTFTRKAAREMKERVMKLCEDHPRCTDITVGNYHSLALRLIKRNPAGFGLETPQLTVLDQGENRSIWKAAIKKAQIPTTDKSWDPKRLDELLSKAINWCKDPLEILRDSYQDDSKEIPSKIETAILIYNNYLTIKKERNSLSFDDLLLLWLTRLQKDKAWAKAIRDRYPNVLVDELQDNNPLNAAILTEISPHRLLGVGDAAQCIYTFRNADPALIKNFQEVPGTLTLPLEDNYRSGNAILQVANQIIEQSSTSLTLQANRSTSGSVRFETFRSEYEENQEVLEWILDKIDEEVPPSQIAVLCRTKRTWMGVELLLKKNRIPYKTYGGISLAQRSEIQDMVAFLRLDYNPKDATAWIRATTLYPGFGTTRAEKIMGKYSPQTIPEKEQPKELKDFFKTSEDIKSLTNLPEKMERVLETLEPLLEIKYKEDFEDRIESLQDFINSTTEQGYELEELLENFAIEAGEDPKHPEDAIILSTIHSAKGLEWKCVWLLGVGSQQIPHSRCKTPEEREEEKRLMYVAVTRAKDELVCSYSKNTRTGEQWASPFLYKNFKKKRH